MATNKRILYHWTHYGNLPSILASGLDPSNATGELFAVWGCESQRADWACDHVASRHRWLPDNLVLLRIRVVGKRVYRTCWPGVFYTPELVYPKDIEVCRDRDISDPIPLDHYIANQNTPV